jgi:YHS domain-containing protein
MRKYPEFKMPPLTADGIGHISTISRFYVPLGAFAYFKVNSGYVQKDMSKIYNRRFIMKLRNTMFITTMFLLAAMFSTAAYGEDYTHSTPGVNGYDPVAYFEDDKPMKGSGFHVSDFEGVTYAFASKEHKKMFDADPEKYIPVYGGYCAYGVAVGKKFLSDPEVWKIVEGKLYLNVDKDIQKKWAKDIPGFIKKADDNWLQIKDKAPSDL